MIDKINNGIEFICVDDDKGIYTVSYKDNNLFTNRFDSNLPNKTISINEAINILDDKGLMVTDKKLALTVCSKWVLID